MDEVKRRKAILVRFRQKTEDVSAALAARDTPRGTVEGFLLTELRLAFWRGYEAGRDISELEVDLENRKIEHEKRKKARRA